MNELDSEDAAYIAISLIIVTALVTSGISFVIVKNREKKEMRDAINNFNTQTQIELMTTNIKSVNDIRTLKKGNDYLIAINGEFYQPINGSYNWNIIYNVDAIEYMKLSELSDYKDKTKFICSYIYPYYEPVEVSFAETEMSLEYSPKINEDYEFTM